MPLLMKHHAARAGGVGGVGGAQENQGDVIRGRTPIIFCSESGSDSSSSTQGYPDQRERNPIRRPPPYRTVPLSLTFAGISGSNHVSPVRSVEPGIAKAVHPRARSVPPGSHNAAAGNESGAKPSRPKSIHHEFPFTHQSRRWAPPPVRSASHQFAQLPQQPQRPAQTRCFPLRSSVSHSSFPQSVSLQFDSLVPEWSDSEAPVPSPAPTERRSFVRPSRTSDALDRGLTSPRSSSVPRSQSSPSRSVNSLSLGNRHQRPISHPAGPAGQLSGAHWSAHSSHSALELQRHESVLIGLRHASTSSVSASSLLTARSHGHLNQRQHHHPADVSSCLSLGQHHSSSSSSVTGIPPPAPAPPPRWPPNCFPNGLGQLASATPAPAPSPTSTPSPSSRPLAHLPTDALRTNHGIRQLEKKLDLYVDIIQAQERFVQVSVAQHLSGPFP